MRDSSLCDMKQARSNLDHVLHHPCAFNLEHQLIRAKHCSSCRPFHAKLQKQTLTLLVGIGLVVLDRNVLAAGSRVSMSSLRQSSVVCLGSKLMPTPFPYRRSSEASSGRDNLFSPPYPLPFHEPLTCDLTSLPARRH